MHYDPNYNQSLLSGDCFTNNYKTMNNVDHRNTQLLTYNANNTVQKLDEIGSSRQLFNCNR